MTAPVYISNNILDTLFFLSKPFPRCIYRNSVNKNKAMGLGRILAFWIKWQENQRIQKLRDVYSSNQLILQQAFLYCEKQQQQKSAVVLFVFVVVVNWYLDQI